MHLSAPGATPPGTRGEGSAPRLSVPSFPTGEEGAGPPPGGACRSPLPLLPHSPVMILEGARTMNMNRISLCPVYTLTMPST